MAQFKDQTGNTISLAAVPQRIISLVPSQTELLADLGLEINVIGITKFCVRPAEWRAIKTIVGGTKRLKPAVIESLSPDLILANKEENERDQVLTLKEKFPVWTSDIHNLDDAIQMIHAVGMMTGTAGKAISMTDRIRSEFDNLLNVTPAITAAYLIWQNPYMAAGSDTFIDSMMRAAGFINIFSQSRYPETTIEQLRSMQPDVVLLSSEPFPFREKHANEIARLLPHSKCINVDGEMFSWYGSRLLYAAAYFSALRKGLNL